MDDLFKIRVLTAAVNAMKAPVMKVYNRIFRGKEHMDVSDRLAFDIITGSQKILKNISIYAPATVTDKTGRKTVTITAVPHRITSLAQRRNKRTVDAGIPFDQTCQPISNPTPGIKMSV